MDGHGRSYVSEAIALGVFGGFIWLFMTLASTTSQPLLRAFFYWAVAGGTSTLLVASTITMTTPQGAQSWLPTMTNCCDPRPPARSH